MKITNTPKWLYDIMSDRINNPHNSQGWNRYIKNNYDIRNLIFSYVPSKKKIIILYTDVPYKRSIITSYHSHIIGPHKIVFVPIVIFRGEEHMYDNKWLNMPEVD